MVPPFLQPHPDLQSAVGNAPVSSKHPAQLPTTDCLLSIIPLMGGQSSNAPAFSPPSPLPQGGQPIALALSSSSPPPQDGQPSDAPGLSPSSSTLLLCPSDCTLSICHLNSQSAVKTVQLTAALYVDYSSSVCDTSGPVLLQQVVTMHMCAQLINDEAIARLPQVAINTELDAKPSYEEVNKAIKQMTTGKAPGPNAIPAEEVVSQDPVKLIEQTFALISQGLNLPSATQDGSSGGTQDCRDIDDGGYGLDYSEDIIPDDDNVSNEAQPITGGQSQGIAAQEPKRKKAKSRPASASEDFQEFKQILNCTGARPFQEFKQILNCTGARPFQEFKQILNCTGARPFQEFKQILNCTGARPFQEFKQILNCTGARPFQEFKQILNHTGAIPSS
ncbi:hypothetical protein ACOMHN_052242 [Nucella lapillus]